MTAYTPIRATHKTLGAATLDSVTFASGDPVLKITNRDATQVIYFRCDATDAVVAADNNYIVPAGVGNAVYVLFEDAVPKVTLISTAGGAYSAETFPALGAAMALSGTSSGGGGAVTNAGTFAVQDSQVVTEDAAEASGVKMFMAGAVRRDTAASSSGTDGDYSTLNVDSTGRLHSIASQAGTWTVQPGNTANTTAWKVDGSAVTQPVSGTVTVNAQPTTSGGPSIFMASGSDGSTALTSTAQAAKASAGQVYGWYIYNPNATAQFVHFYDTAQGSVTVGTTNPLFTLTIPATAAANLIGGIPFAAFATAITIAATSTAGGNGAPGTALDAVISYK